MNKFSKTLLVIGAGAHVPYDMPTSRKLTKTIKELVSHCKKISFLQTNRPGNTDLDVNKIRICRLLRDMKIINPSPDAVNNAFDIAIGEALDSLVSSFARSKVYSIDRYLANSENSNLTPTNVKIGKLLITFFIKTFEEAKPWGFHEPDW